MKITVKEVFEFKVHAAKLQPKNGMEQSPEGAIQWQYTRKEWNHFLKATGWKKNWPALFRLLFARCIHRKVPVVHIKPDQMSIGPDRYYFFGERKKLRNVEIREEGPVNVICFEYENLPTDTERWKVIKVPVPRGRLKEALRMREHLLSTV